MGKRQREIDCVRESKSERESERLPSRLCAVCVEPDVGLELNKL